MTCKCGAVTSELGSSDDLQSRVISALEDRSARLAGIYRLALATLALPAIQGCEAARVSVICHCMRELMIGVPGVLAESVIPRIEPSSAALIAKLPDLLATHRELDLGVDQDVVPVPQLVARAFLDLVSARTQENGRNRHNATALITAGTDDAHPAISQWSKTYKFFVGWTHLDRYHEQGRTLPSDELIASHMRVVEDVIEVRSKAFFDNLHALEDLLNGINASDETES